MFDSKHLRYGGGDSGHDEGMQKHKLDAIFVVRRLTHPDSAPGLPGHVDGR